MSDKCINIKLRIDRPKITKYKLINLNISSTPRVSPYTATSIKKIELEGSR